MKSGFFITGTDTGVGKTVVSTILTVGLRATYWKPVQTGAEEGTDSQFVSRWAGRARVWPEACIFSHPSSPHIAAAREGKIISLAEISASSPRSAEIVVAEGAGGALVPLNESDLIADLIHALRLPAIIVASTRLGTINHTFLTAQALKARSIRVAGFVSVGENDLPAAKTISEFAEIPHLGHVPICRSFSHQWFLDAFYRLRLPIAHQENADVLRP